MIQDNPQVSILLVEDDPGHARLIEKNLRRAGLANPIQKFTNGSSVLDYLYKKDANTPNNNLGSLLMLLDLNLPEIDGYEVLRLMKTNDRLKQIPVIILTTTDDPRETKRCYGLGCNVFITKPVDYDRFSHAVRNLGLFLSVVTIPEGD